MAGFESLGGYTATGGFTPEVGFSVDTTNTKQANLARIAAEKKTALIPLSTVRHNDADTFNVPNSIIRLDGLSNGAGVDSWEVPHAGKTRPAKLDLQREALAKLTGFSVSQITDQDVYEFGNKSNEYVKSILRKGQEGVTNPQVAITTSNELDKFNRKLANVSNPLTGEDLASALNNPLHNAGYDAFYNKSKKDADTYNSDRVAGEFASDSLKSLIGKGTLGLSTLLAGAIDLPGRAVGEALYRTGINDSTWAPNDATGLYEKINDAKSQLNQSMSPTLKKEIALLDEKIATRDATRDFRTRKTAEQLGASDTVKDFVIAPMKWGADVARDITDGLLDHPAAAVDMLLENVVTMGASGAAAKTGVKALVAKTAQTAATEAKILAATAPTASSVTTANALSNVAEEATKLAAKSGELKSLATMTTQEVTGNTGETLSGVMNTPINELRSTSSDFRSAEKLFIAQGMSAEEAASKAQLQIANDSANAVAAMSLITAPLAAKLTGASKFESNLFNKGGVVGKAIGGLRSELPEETLQGFTGQLASNIANQTYVDSTTKLSEGLSGATAKSALAGGLMGATIPAAIDITLKAPQAINTASDTIVNATGQVASKVGSTVSNLYNSFAPTEQVATLSEQIKEAHTTGDYSKIVASGDIQPADIVNSMLETQSTSASKVNQENYTAKLREHTLALKEQVLDIADSMEGMTDAELATDENIALTAQRIQLTDLLTKSVNTLKASKINSETDVADRIASIPENTEVDTNTLGSLLPKASEAQLDILATKVPEASVQAEMISNRREVLAAEKTALSVSKEIRDGGTVRNTKGDVIKVKGYTEYQDDIAEAVQVGNTSLATKALDRLGNFASTLETKLASYTEAANIANKAYYAKEAVVKAAVDKGVTAKEKRTIVAEEDAKITNAIQEANAYLASKGLHKADGNTHDFTSSYLLNATKDNIANDLNLVKLAHKESSLLVSNISSKEQYENNTINKVAKEGTAALEELKTKKIASKVKQGVTATTVTQLDREIAYIDGLLVKQATTPSEVTNANNNNDAITAVVTESSELTSDNTQGSMDVKSVQSDGSGKSSSTNTSTRSLENTSVTGSRNRADTSLNKATVPVTKISEIPVPTSKLSSLSNLSLKDKLTMRNFGLTDLFKLVDKYNPLTDNSEMFEEGSIPSKYKGNETYARIASFISKFTNDIYTHVKVSENEYGNNVSKYLLDTSGKLPKEIVNLMSAATLEWIASKGTKSIFTTKQAAAAILGIQEEQVTQTQLEVLAGTNTLRSVVAISIGKQVLSGAGITPNSIDVAEHHFENLASELGLHALNTLVQTGLATYTGMSAVQFKATVKSELTTQEILDLDKLTGKEISSTQTKGANLFITLAYEVNTETGLQPSQKIKELTENSNSLLKLLDTIQEKESTRTEHLFTKPSIKNISKYMKGTIQQVPKRMLDIAVKYMQQPNFVNIATYTEFTKMPEYFQKKMLGYTEAIDGKLQVVEPFLKATQSTNSDILISLAAVREFITDISSKETGLATPFYLTSEFWKQLRLGMNSSTINTQNNKLHRALFGVGKPHTVAITDIAARQLHVRALAQAFGVKTDKLDPDVNSMPTRIEDLIAPTDLNIFKVAAEAMNASGTAQLTTEQSELVITAVKLGGEGMHTYSGIVALAEELKATASGSVSFETTLNYEVDGKTNGPIISFLQLAGAKDLADLKRRMAMGGMFSDGITDNYFKHVFNGGLDTYEAFGKVWSKTASNIVANLSPVELTKFEELTKIIGSLDEPNKARKLAKPAVTVFSFGASIKTIKASFAQSGLTDLYTKINDNQTDFSESGVLAELSKSIKIITGIEHTFTKENVLTKLPNNIEKAFIYKINTTLGEALQIALDLEFADMTKNRKMMNTAMQLSFHALTRQYDIRLKEFLVENATRTPAITGITKAQRDSILESIQDISPVIKSYFSESLEDAIVAYKESKYTFDSTDYTGQANTTKPMTVHRLDGTSFTVRSSTAVAALDYVENPGVAAVIQMVHSLDSSTMMLALNELLNTGIPVLNIFDAVVTSANDTATAGDALNTAFERVMREYDMATEIYNTYETVRSALTRTDLVTLNNSFRSTLKKSSIKNENGEAIEGLHAFTNYFKSEVAKINALKAEYLAVHTFTTQYVGLPNRSKESNTDSTDAKELTERQADVFDTEVSNVIEELSQAVKTASTEQTNSTDSTLGSNQEGMDINTFQPELVQVLSAEHINQVMDDLGRDSVIGVRNTIDSTVHKDYLTTFISNTASNLSHKINGLILKTKKSVGDTIGAQYNTSTGRYVLLDVGTSAGRTLTSKSSQEIFAHEITHVITEYGLRNSPLLRKQVERLKDSVMDYLLVQPNPIEFLLTYDSNGDILTTQGNTVQQEIDAAQDHFNYMFGLDGSGKKWKRTSAITNAEVEQHNNNSVHEFVAFGKTNAKTIEMLSAKAMNDTLKKQYNKSVWDKNVFVMIGNVFKKMMSSLVGTITVSPSLDANVQLDALVGKLSLVVNRNDPAFQQSSGITVNVANTVVKKLQKMIIGSVATVANTNFVKQSSSRILATSGSVANNIQYVSYPLFKIWAKNVARRLNISDRAFAIAALRENISGRTDENSYLYNFVSAFKHGIDQARNDVRVRAANNLLNAFGNTKLNNSVKAALSMIVIKLDLHNAVDAYGMPKVQQMLTDTNTITVELNNLRTQLKAITSNDALQYFSKMSESLGSRLARGEKTQDLDHLSAYTIVREASVTAPTNLAEAQRIVSIMATLHGIKFSEQTDKKQVNDLITTEYAKSSDQLTEDGENGITYLLKYLKDTRQRSKDILFAGKEGLMTDGYTVELFDPKVQYAVVTEAEAEAERLISRGYVKGKRIPLNPAFANSIEPLYMYVNNFDVTPGRVSSAFSVMEDKSKGSKLKDIPLQQIMKHYAATLAAQATSASTPADNSSLAPVRNADGKIVGFRYMMDEKTKNNLLKKNNSFETVLGAIEADLTVKPAAKNQNVAVINALYKDWKANVYKDPKAYIVIGPTSTDPEFAEIYKLLPREAKEAIKATFGGAEIYMREQDVRLVFGFKKYHIGMFDKHWTDQQKTTATVLEKVGMKVAEMLNSKFVLRGAHTWEFLVKTAKDAIVIKFGSVMVANIASNNALLWTKGLSNKMVGAYQLEAIEMFNKYQKDNNTVKSIERRIRLDPALKNNNVVMGKLSNAKSAITNNPVSKLLDAGVFQSIIEDIEIEDPHSFRSTAETFIGEYIDKIPKSVKTFGNVIIMSHDTKLYKAMRVTTQMSDFVARYALHKFNLEQKNKDGSMRFTEQSSIEDINDTFIQYDIPTSPGMEYLNNMGIVMFTKYMFRIKKQLFKIAVRSPGRVLASIFMTEAILDTANVFTSTNVFPSIAGADVVLDNATNLPLLELSNSVLDIGASVDGYVPE